MLKDIPNTAEPKQMTDLLKTINATNTAVFIYYA